MNLIHRLQIQKTLAGFRLGLFIAVQALVFLEKGFSAWHIGIALGIFAASAAILEVPLGALADLKGRIRVFKWSLIVDLTGWILAIYAKEFWLIAIAMILLGLSRALNTGTVDAWQVEQIHKMGLQSKLAQILAKFQATSSLAIGLGALAGGYLPDFAGNSLGFNPTEWNLIAALCFVFAQLVLLGWLFQEGDKNCKINENQQIHSQIKKTLLYGWRSPAIRPLFYVAFVFGLILVCIEAFWQIQIKVINPDATYSVFGWLALGYFFSGALGQASIGLLMPRAKISEGSWITIICILVAPVLYGLTVQQNISGFAIYYLVFMGLLSMINIPLETLMHRNLPDHIRSSMGSVFSLVLLTGGAVSSFGLSALVEIIGVARVWQILAGVLVIFAVLRICKLPGFTHNEETKKPLEIITE